MRVIVTPFVALTATFVFSSIARATTVGYWRFEEGTANTAASGGGSIIDSSTNGDNGTPVNGPVYTSNVPTSTIPQTGAPDSLSMLFNGVNQRVFIPDSPALALTHSLTLEAYIDPLIIPTASASQIVFRGDDRVGLDPYELSLVDGELRFLVADSSNNTAIVEVPFTAVNKWTFVAGTLDDATGVMDLYENGDLVASGTTTIRPYATLDSAKNPGLGIGNTQSGNYNEYFNGYIDEVRISDVALSPSQMLDAVPEPATFGVLATGMLSILLRRRRA